MAKPIIPNELYSSPTATALNLGYGLQVLNTTRITPYNILNITGRTLVNLLGRDGNCEDTSKWSIYGVGTGTTVALDSTNKTIGSNSIKFTSGTSTDNGIYKVGIPLVSGGYYIVLADIKNGTLPQGVKIQFANIASALITSSAGFTTAWMKCSPAASSADLYVFSTSSVAASGQYANVDAIRIYQLTLAEYNALDSMSVLQIANKYPYVDDVKHVNTPYIIRYGENQLPTFNEYTTGSIPANSLSILSPYSISLALTTSNQWITCDIVCSPSQIYTFSVTMTGEMAVDQIDKNGTIITSGGIVPFTTAQSATFTTASNAVTLRIYFGVHVNGAGTYTFTNPILNLGSTAKTFKPRNDDYLYFPNTAIASSTDGTVYDQIFRRDGKFWRENRFIRDFVLDGSLGWTISQDMTGAKEVKIPITSYINYDSNARTVKYDGKILKNNTSTGSNGASTNTDTFNVWSDGYLYLQIADTDSGFGETYTPTAGEIQAYFYGWKMYDNGVDYTAKYSSGVRAWCYRNNGSTGVVSADYTGGTNTLPTTLAGNGYKPYKLTYQLATSTLEEIPFEGSISTLEGSNQFEVGNGMIVREKANPAYYPANNEYLINNTAFPTSQLKNRTLKIINVYKNGRIDLNWSYPGGSTYGLAQARCAFANYDPSATYEVTYLALDQYALTANVQTINGEYDTNVKMVVDRLTQSLADVDTRVSINERRLGGVQNAWGDNTRDSRSIVMTGAPSALTLSTNNTWYKTPFPSKLRDNLSEFDITLYRFTAKKTGTYDVKAAFGVNSLTTGYRVLVAIFKNGSISQYIGDIQYTGTQYGISHGSILIDLFAGDYVELYANPANGSAIPIDTSNQVTYMHIMQIA
jgi:hypothetical protein